MTTKYKAKINYDAYLDDYEQGELSHANSWIDEIVKDSKKELKEAILEATYQKDFSTIDDEQANEYDWCTEYHTSYLTDENNIGDASDEQIKQWQNGKLKLYSVNCHILVTKLTESKAKL